MATAQDTDRARPASGISIDPAQLTRMRDLKPLSRAGLAAAIGEVLFDRDRFAEVLTARVQPDAQTARALWLALDASPGDVIRGLPARLPDPEVPLWLRRNPGEWTLDTRAVTRLRRTRATLDENTGEIRMWTNGDLADAVSRHWFSRDMINKIETGTRRPSPETLAAVCQVLGCEPEDLMEGSDPLPDGQTAEHLALIRHNAEMRALADAKGISYRSPGTGRIRYKVLREAWEAAGGRHPGQDDGVRRGIRVRNPEPLDPVSVMGKPPAKPGRTAKP